MVSECTSKASAGQDALDLKSSEGSSKEEKTPNKQQMESKCTSKAATGQDEPDSRSSEESSNEDKSPNNQQLVPECTSKASVVQDAPDSKSSEGSSKEENSPNKQQMEPISTSKALAGQVPKDAPEPSEGDVDELSGEKLCKPGEIKVESRNPVSPDPKQKRNVDMSVDSKPPMYVKLRVTRASANHKLILERFHVYRRYDNGATQYRNLDPVTGVTISTFFNNGNGHVFFKDFVEQFWYHQNLRTGVRVTTQNNGEKVMECFKPEM